MTKQEAKQQIQKLIDKYKRIEDADDLNSYNEARTRNEFIEPLFEFLGWDMRNLNNANEVIPEESSSGGRIDLAFRINNIPVMFLEAKALGKNLDDPQWAEQVINYSWNKGVTWAVLTDFEAIKVFNAETPPKDPEKNKFLELSWQSYISDFDDLWMLSKEGFSQGLLAKKAEKYGGLVKRKPVGDKLFEDLTAWRALLTKSVGRSNKLSEEELDHGIQKILDRLVFIRTAEDRKLEANVLQSIVHSWESREQKGNLYEQLVSTFRNFDEGYDSTLFGPHNSEKWEINNDALAQVINGLYKTKDGYRYDFAAISVDVLGSIYQHYLGYVQQKSKKGAEIAESKKRKKQGIFYTPRYIADFIVKETLGEVLKKTKPKDISKIKVLDPACGSGSFLTAAYDEFISYYEKQKRPKDQINLFTKLDILKNNLYGVDLDGQAVEIAQLNLLLKVLFQRDRLPSLQNNVRNGNSLVSGDETSLKPYFGDKWRDQKPFNWQEEFKEVFDQGGFDVVIGNPPYIKEDTNKAAFDGLHDDLYYQGKMDIWTLFACRSIDLLKEGGYLSFIATSNWVTSSGASIFRNKILSDGEILKFVDFNDFKVFKDASIQTMIFVFQKKKPRKSYKLRYAKITNKNISSDEVTNLLTSGLDRQIENSNVFDATIKPTDIGNKSISFSNDTVTEVLDKIANTGNFKFSKNDIGNGIDVLQDFITNKHLAKLKDETIKKGDGVFVLKNSVIAKMKFNSKELEYLKPYFTTSQISRYLSDQKNEYKIIYADKYFREHIDEFPNLKNHIDRFQKILTSAFAPYGLHRPREERFFKGQAIFLLRKTMHSAFTYVDFPCYVTRAFLVLKPEKINLKYLTALLNSKLIYFWLKHKGKKQGEQLQIDKGPLMETPLLKIEEKEQEKISLMVDRITAKNAELHKTSQNTDKWRSLKAEIEKLDQQIDQEVYKLYGLTDEEIKIVENE